MTFHRSSIAFLIKECYIVRAVYGMAWFGKAGAAFCVNTYQEVFEMTENKKLEQRLCRTLRKLGYELHKSRKRNWSCDDQCGYMIIDTSTNGVVNGTLFDLSLDDVSEWVKC